MLFMKWMVLFLILMVNVGMARPMDNKTLPEGITWQQLTEAEKQAVRERLKAKQEKNGYGKKGFQGRNK